MWRNQEIVISTFLWVTNVVSLYLIFISVRGTQARKLSGTVQIEKVWGLMVWSGPQFVFLKEGLKIARRVPTKETHIVLNNLHFWGVSQSSILLHMKSDKTIWKWKHKSLANNCVINFDMCLMTQIQANPTYYLTNS